jgi:aminopeptidase N
MRLPGLLGLVVVVVACSSPVKPPSTAVTPASAAESPGPAAVAADPAPPGLRLPGDVKPARYRLELTVLPEDRTATGHVMIEAEVVKATNVVWLNATGLTVSNARLGGRPARVVAGGESFVGLVPESTLAPGALTIDADFVAPIDHARSLGLYAEKEGAETYAYTMFEPTDARRTFPCFDEPSYKVPWQLTFHVKRAHVALANAPVATETDEPNGMKRVELAWSKPMPSYLVAFVVGPFELVDGGVAGRIKTPIRFVIPKGRSGELGWAKDVTPRVVTALEDYFDMPYPYLKLDVAVVPRYWGTMEHPGIVAMGQPLTLIRPDQATHPRKYAYANILAHELAHYWFGDYVTLAWWDDTWLNESLGQWMDMIITDAVEPTWRYGDERGQQASYAMTSDETLAADPIRKPVTTAEGIQASFDGAITYVKGSSVLRMFEASVEPTKWRDLMRAYVRKHAWGTATADDLFAAIREHLGPDVEAGMRSFVEQPGVPRISAQLACKDGAKLVLHQSRSLPAGVTAPAAQHWNVPVCVRYGNATQSHRACTTLKAADGELALEGTCPTWTILNAGANGYYRSVVDPAVARQLLTPGSAIAKAAKPTPAEKMMIAVDLRAAVERNEIQMDAALALAPVVATDRDDKVALGAFGLSGFRSDVLDDELRAKAIKYFVRTYGPLATRLGWKRKPGDKDERQELRRSAMTFARYDPELAKQASALAFAWLADRSAIEDDMATPVLATAAVRGDQKLFDAILNAARSPRDRIEQQRLLLALGGFTDPAIAARALELVLGTEFDLRESLGILYMVMNHRETRELAATFVEAHLDEILARMREDEASWLLDGLASRPCERKLHDRMATLVTPRAAKVAGAAGAVKRGLELSDQCIANLERQLPALRAFLK